MTDQEMTRLCAEARGLTPRTPTLKKQFNERIFEFYNPLHDDAQAMALVKKLKLDVTWSGTAWKVCDYGVTTQAWNLKGDLNRAIVECVAKMQKEKR